MKYEIVKLTDKPELKEQAAQWFHEKWGIPLKEYTESMDECLKGQAAVPQWYIAVENNRIIPFMNVMGGSFSVWYRGMERLK